MEQQSLIPNVIAFLGPINSGKTFTAKIFGEVLEKKLGKSIVHFSFANIIKEVSQILFGLTEEETKSRELKEQVHPDLGVTPREILQVFGTEFLREELPRRLPKLSLEISDGKFKLQTESITTKHAYMLISKEIAAGKIVLIDDLRFNDELKLLRHIGGLVVRVIRKSENTEFPLKTNSKAEDVTSKRSKHNKRRRVAEGTRRATKQKTSNQTHRSEIEQREIQPDFEVYNNGSDEELKKICEKLLKYQRDEYFTAFSAGNAILRRYRSSSI